MWWKKARRLERPLREELTEAAAVLGRQLEVLRSPTGIKGSPDNRSIIAELEGQLGQIKAALAEMDSSSA